MSLPASVLVASACRPRFSEYGFRHGRCFSSPKRSKAVVNIFVGNLSYQTTQDELEAAFSQYGAVERVSIVTDRATGQPRGFAFVEMTDQTEADNAIAQLNGAEIHGRAVNVNVARPKPSGGFGGRKEGSRRSGAGGRGDRW